MRDRPRRLRDDLLSLMLRAKRDGRPLREEHVLANAFLTLGAGTHTTSWSISDALVQFDLHRDQRR
jgi:cytochrome P450